MDPAMQIAERLRQMPPKYRETYRRAVKGRSLRACINAQCLECCSWQSGEVARCSDCGCPLHSVRPYQNGSRSRQDGQFLSAEGRNAHQGVLFHG